MVSVRMKRVDGRNNKIKNDISGFISDTPCRASLGSGNTCSIS